MREAKIWAEKVTIPTYEIEGKRKKTDLFWISGLYRAAAVKCIRILPLKKSVM